MLIRLATTFNSIFPPSRNGCAAPRPSFARKDLLEPDELQTEPKIDVTSYFDSFGNRCARFVAPKGQLRLSSSTLIRDSGEPDPVNLYAREVPSAICPTKSCATCSTAATARSIASPTSHLSFLDTSRPAGRACRPSATGSTTRWHSTISRRGPPKQPWMCSRSAWACAATFSIWPSPSAARSTFPPATPPAIWAISACPWSCPWTSAPGSRSGSTNRWWTFDARNNQPRIGRVLMATGRDASDVAMTTSFGQADLRHFFVVDEEEGRRPLSKCAQ